MYLEFKMFPSIEISLRQAGLEVLEQGRFQRAWLRGLGNIGLTFHGCVYSVGRESTNHGNHSPPALGALADSRTSKQEVKTLDSNPSPAPPANHPTMP